jgi:hypothetical protein
MYPEDRDYPMCDEHARVEGRAHEANDWGLAEEITGDWMRIARAWRLKDLEHLAAHAHEKAKEETLKADTRCLLLGF